MIEWDKEVKTAQRDRDSGQIKKARRRRGMLIICKQISMLITLMISRYLMCGGGWEDMEARVEE